MAEHARLAPSDAKQWMLCPGSVQLIESMDVEEEPNPSAEEGSAAHAIAEYCLKNKVDAASKSVKYYQKKFAKYKQYINDEMLEHVQFYVDTIRKAKKPNDKLVIEKKRDMSWIHPEIFGTPDCIIIPANKKVLKVYDLKYGIGIVDPEENPQQILYALGALGERGLNKYEKVKITIVQPRPPHPDGPVRSWIMKPKTIKRWAKKLQTAANKCFEPHPPLVAGDEQCLFCLALGDCPEVPLEAVRTARAEFGVEEKIEDVEIPKPNILNNDEISRALGFIKLLTPWANAVKASAIKRFKKGEKIPGYKVVHNRAHRKWIDEQEVIDELSCFYGIGDITKTTLLSPSQMEKKLDMDFDDIEHLWHRQFKPDIVKESDKRPALDKEDI